ncbi:MAG: iron ABC transporter permease [Pseudomonadota bacterium]
MTADFSQTPSAPTRLPNRLTVTLPVGLLIAALIAGGLFSIATGGRTDIGLSDAVGLFLALDDSIGQAVIRDIRLPRTATAALLGVNLALAGLALQAVTRNPLASPSILGINQGAALGLALSLIAPSLVRLSPEIAASLGALFAGLLTFAIAGGFTGRLKSMRLILGGLAVGAFCYAVVRFAYTLEDELARTVVRWTIGDITDVRWPAAERLLFWAIPGFLAATALAQRFNLMALGVESAQGVGSDPRVTLAAGILLAACLAGISVSVAGPIAFAGLIVPHIAKMMFGGDHRLLVPTSALIGAALMLFADGLSKWVTAPIESPIGVIAALIGTPWFLWQAIIARDTD